MLDIIICGGTLYDGTGAPGVRADIGIRSGKIEKIGILDSEEAKVRIDASGKAVTPGLIDMHSHIDCSIPMWPNAESALGQGITTCFAGHCGMSVAPVPAFWLEQCFEQRAFDLVAEKLPGGPIPGDGRVVETDKLRPAFAQAYGETLDWSSFGEYLGHMERVGHGVNFSANVGHSQLRLQVLGRDCCRPATKEEISRMCTMLEESLQEGAFGLSFGFDYVSSMYAEEDELLALMKTAARYDAVVTAHMQTGPERRGQVNTDYRMVDGLLEFLELGMKSGAKLHISHIYTFFDVPSGDGRDAAAKEAVEKTQAIFADYRSRGLRLTWDYLGMQPAACFFFPQLATKFGPYIEECGGKHAFSRRLRDSEYRNAVADEIRSGNHRAFSPFASMGRVGGSRWGANILITRCSDTQFTGKTVGQISEELGMDCVDTALELMLRDCETMCDRVRDVIAPVGPWYVRDDDMCFGLDNGAHDYDFLDASGEDMPYVLGTPTEFGGMIEYFNTFREFPFAALIRRMTGNAAKAMGLSDRGFLKEGMWADIVVLDPANLKSNLNLAEPRTAPDGIDYVLVNGEIAVDHKKHIHVRSGQIIRRPNV